VREVGKPMRPSGLRSLLFGAFVLFMAGALAGCENPFDPLDKSDKIQGLSYVEAATTWEAWDSDPEADGVVIELTYSNEFGDTLDFHDKPHEVVIEFWTQKDIGSIETEVDGEIETSPPYLIQDKLFFSKTIDFENSEDTIRIPIEAYEDAIPEEAYTEVGADADQVFVVVRVFPPQEFPRQELYIAESDVLIFKPVVAEGTQNL
jgi:hypothetical protein